MGAKTNLLIARRAALAAGFIALASINAQALELGERFTTGSSFTLNQNSWGSTSGHDLAWSASRFGLTVDLGTPRTRSEDATDISAGAYYRITPSLRLGGQLKLGTSGTSAARAVQPDEREPRVRLETAFQF